jgi:hypothetical protein
MKIKLEDALEAYAALDQLMARRLPAGKRLPVKVVHTLQRNLRQLSYEWRDYRATNTSLIKKHGEEELQDGKPTGNYKIDQANVDALHAYWQDHDELVQQETEVDLRPLPAGALDTLDLSLAEIAALSILFDGGREVSMETP